MNNSTNELCQLEARVAEEVLGYERYHFRNDFPNGWSIENLLGTSDEVEKRLALSEEGKVIWERGWHEEGGDRPQNTLPRFARDIAEAWKVVEVMREKPFSTRHRFTGLLRLEVLRRVTGGMVHREVVLHLEPADLCRAALAAVEQADSDR